MEQVDIVAALLKAPRELNFASISLLADGEGAIVLCVAVIRSLEVRFNPAEPGQHVPAGNEAFGPSSRRSERF